MSPPDNWKSSEMDDDKVPVAAPKSESLRATLVDAFGPLLSEIREVIVIGFGAQTNAGDSMIWLGQIRLLRTLGINVRGVAQIGAFDERMLKRLPPHVAVILAGGGSFGDLWPHLQLFRERIIQAAAGRRVIQFPQSLCFRDETNIRFVRDVLVQHGDIVLAWRDTKSYESAIEIFPETPSMLVPDVAFALGPMKRAAPPKLPVLCISREDHEGGELCAVRLDDGIQVDWATGGSVSAKLRRELIFAVLNLERNTALFLGNKLRTAMYGTHASITFEIAKSTVSRAEVVVSDRLHAHILCLQLEIPHVMVDTRNGKISSFIDTWTADSNLVTVVSSPRDAIDIARSIVAEQHRERNEI